MFLPVWKDVGMLVLAVNAGVVFTLDVNQCSFSCTYGTANPDLFSLSLLAGSLSAFTLISDTLAGFSGVCTCSPHALASPLSLGHLALVIQAQSQV